MSNQGNKDANQGEGDKVSARKYTDDVQTFVGEKRVERAAKEAKAFVEANPVQAAADEAAAKAGPAPVRHRLDDLVTEGKAMWSRAKTKLQTMMKR